MIKVGRIHAHPPKRAKTRRWWRYLDLLLIVLLFSFLLIWLQGPASARLFFSTIASLAQPTSLTQSYTGLNTIAIPLQKLALQAQPTSVDCGNIDLPQGDLQTCLEGQNSPDTYTQNPAPKIQNPLAKGSALFYYTPPDITVDNSNVITLWGFVMGIVDVLIAVIIMLQGVRIMLTGSVFCYAQVIEELPGILLALILAHISLTFVTMTIGLNNNMVNYIYTFAAENPNIHRSASGFGNGNKKEYVLRVFFPSMLQSDKQLYENGDFSNVQDTAKMFPGPEKVEQVGKGTTAVDLKQFNKPDLVCTLKTIHYDTEDRAKLFGSGSNPENTPIYQNIVHHVTDIISYADMHKQEATQKKMEPADLQDLLMMPVTIKKDLGMIKQNPLQWYQDYFAFSKRLADYRNEYMANAYGNDPYNDAVKKTSELKNDTIFLFNGSMGGDDTPGAEDFAVVGDAVIYSCEEDATGTSFQLVPDDLNFTDLFKNLKDLGKSLDTISKVLAVMLLGQMIIRLIFINLYTVVAPLCIACGALPGKIGQPIVRMWLQGFISLVLVQFLMTLAVIVTQILLGEILAFTGGDPQHVAGNLNRGTLSDIMRIACLWFVIRIPSLLQSAPARTMVDVGQSMAQVVGTSMTMQIAQFQMNIQLALMGTMGGIGGFGVLRKGVGGLRSMGR